MAPKLQKGPVSPVKTSGSPPKASGPPPKAAPGPGPPPLVAALGGGASLDEFAFDRRADPKPMFRLAQPDDAMLAALRPDGPPAPKVWEESSALARTSGNLFRLRVATLPELHASKGTQYSRRVQLQDALLAQMRAAPSVGDSTEAAAAPPPPAPLAPAPPSKPRKRADRYFDLLMKAHTGRCEEWTDGLEEDAKERAEASAYWASFKAIRADRRAVAAAAKLAEECGSSLRSAEEARLGSSAARDEDSDADADKDEALVPEGLDPLVEFDGAMELDLEVVLLRPPGEDAPSEASTRTSTPTSGSEYSSSGSGRGSRGSGRSSKAGTGPSGSSASRRGDSKTSGRDGSKAGSSRKGSNSSDGRINLYEELEQLKQEMGADEAEKSDSSDELPEGLRVKRIQNIWDNPKPRWSLGLGGTVFFVPDAERYAFGHSLPPPPPPSLQGRRRLRLKPRLPLEVSHGRYRDEHPNIWPEPPFSPDLTDYQRFEQQMLTLDFYRGCSQAMTRLPRAQSMQDLRKQRVEFGRSVVEVTERSQAWKNYNFRMMLKAKQEASASMKEAEERMKAEQTARIAALASAAGLA